MKILLSTPFRRFHIVTLGLAYIAAAVEGAGHEVKVCEPGIEDIDENEYLKVVDNYKPDVIGFTSTTTDINGVLSATRKIKKKYPDIPLIMGGPHCTALPEDVIDNGDIDIVVRGEGDRTIVELLETLAGNGPLGEVNGISFKDNGAITHTGPRKPIKDLDSLPLPAKHLYPIKEYRKKIRLENYPGISSFGTIVTSRGCPFNCIYCASDIMHGQGFRKRSIESVVEEIESVTKDYHENNFYILDDTFTVFPERVVAFCEEIIKRNLKIIWRCLSRVDMDPDIFKLMYKSGCRQVDFGVESGDDEILKKINKKITTAQVRQAIETAKRAGLMIQVFMMIGNYEDTPETIKKTLKFAKSLKPDFMHISICIPFPGTKLFDIYKDSGYLKTMDWNEYTFFTCPYETPELKGFDMVRYRHLQEIGFRYSSNHLKSIMQTGGLTGMTLELLSNTKTLVKDVLLA